MTPRQEHLLQVDLLKGAAILAVLLLHSLSWQTKHDLLAVFHIWQAVPVFFILMGFTGGLSLRRRYASPLAEISARRYILARAIRILFPFGIVWLLALMFGLVEALVSADHSWSFGLKSFVGYLPWRGGRAGNYFVSALLQCILLLPLVYELHRRNRLLSLVACFLVDLTFELCASRILFFSTHPYLYSACALRYLFAIGLGMWLVDGFEFKRRSVFMLTCTSLISVSYLAAWQLFSFRISLFHSQWQPQNLIAFLYPFVLVVIGLNYFPARTRNSFWAALAKVGRASYHIFLAQMLYFTLVWQAQEQFRADVSSGFGFHAGLLLVIVNVLICLLLGLLLVKVDTKLVQSLFGGKLVQLSCSKKQDAAEAFQNEA